MWRPESRSLRRRGDVLFASEGTILAEIVVQA